MILIGCIGIARPPAPTALASPAFLSSPAGQAGLELSAGYTQSVVPGSALTFAHILTNTGVATESYVLTATWPVTWPLVIGSDLPPSNLSPFSLTLGAGTTATIYLTASVPAESAVISGTQVPLWLTATADLSPTIFVTTTDFILLQGPITYQLYLPSIAHFYGGPLVKLGSDFDIGLMRMDPSVLISDVVVARNMGVEWTRAWLPWALMETAPGEYDWSWSDHQLQQFAQAGFRINAVVIYPPAWAAADECGPITNTVALDSFMTAMIMRYADLVDSWEFINEPDASRKLPFFSPVVGCWGPHPQLYTESLAVFYHKVKELDPTAVVLLGGLAYDNWALFDRDFLTHTLESGAGPYFDVLSLHYYFINQQEFPSIAVKIAEIKAILQRHGVYGKGIWITETSMWTNYPFGTLEVQRDYIVKEQTRALCTGANNVFWFAIREELSTPPLKRWLISKQHQPDQGYTTYQHYARQVQGAFCRGAYPQVPSAVEAYQLGRPDGELYILWTKSGTRQVSLPAGKSATLSDRDGLTSQSLPSSNGRVQVSVGAKPVFVMVKY